MKNWKKRMTRSIGKKVGCGLFESLQDIGEGLCRDKTCVTFGALKVFMVSLLYRMIVHEDPPHIVDFMDQCFFYLGGNAITIGNR